MRLWPVWLLYGLNSLLYNLLFLVLLHTIADSPPNQVLIKHIILSSKFEGVMHVIAARYRYVTDRLQF